MEIQVGNTYECEVIKVIKVGAIVRLSDKSTELIHLSELSDEFVQDCNDFVYPGQKLSALCVAGKVKPICLSVKHCKLPNRHVSDKSAFTDTDDDFATMVEHYITSDDIAASQKEKRAG